MNRPSLLFTLAVLPLMGGCTSDVVDALTGGLESKINTVENCFPPLIDKAEQVLAITEAWRFSDSSVADPLGLSHAIAENSTVLRIEYSLANSTVLMDISFHGPDGSRETVAFVAEQSLAENIALGASALRTRYPLASETKFMLGAWSISGEAGALSGSGNLVGKIGEFESDNALELLLTTTGNTSGGLPPVGPGTIDLQTESGRCRLGFQTSGLQIDSIDGQAYPIGTMSITVVGEASVFGLITFDNTRNALIDIDGVPGLFQWDIEDGDVSYSLR